MRIRLWLFEEVLTYCVLKSQRNCTRNQLDISAFLALCYFDSHELFCDYVLMSVLFLYKVMLANVFLFIKKVNFFSLPLSLSADDPTEADLWLLNSCTVKNPAEDHFRNSIKYWNTKYTLCSLFISCSRWQIVFRRLIGIRLEYGK